MFHESHFMKNKCSKCNGDKELSRSNQRYCKRCHAEYMREHRPKHFELKKEQKKKANTRAYTREYIRRGVLNKINCERCGSEKTEAHHEDYQKPLEVIWLCRKCHLEYHKQYHNPIKT